MPSAGIREIPNVVAVGGGVLIQAAGTTVGAIGVSGAPGGDADEACARAGIAAIRDDIETVNPAHVPTARLTPTTAALLIAPPLFWAGNAVLARALVGDFPPLALSFWRWALAFVLITPFAARAVWQHRSVIRTHFPLLAWTSLLGVGCYNSLQYLALQTSTAVNTTLIGASGPVITLMVGAAFFSFERCTTKVDWGSDFVGGRAMGDRTRRT